MFRKSLLPLLVISVYLTTSLGYLEISFLNIQGYELKETTLNYGWHYRYGDPFTSGETVQNKQYEDAAFSFFPEYGKLLAKDLHFLASQSDLVKAINAEEMYLETDEYFIQVCIDHKKLAVRDSSFFKTMVNMDVLYQLELYDKDRCDMLYSSKTSKYWIRNELICTGWASDSFLTNKLEELLYSQISQRIGGFINRYKNPNRHSFIPLEKPSHVDAKSEDSENSIAFNQ